MDYVGDRVMWLHQLKNVSSGMPTWTANSTATTSCRSSSSASTRRPVGLWAEGDWDGNGTFDSSDFVVAFTDGGYEQGPRTDMAAVPEPATWTLLVIGLVFWLFGRRTCAI